MSYDALEQSIETGSPFELYLFENLTDRFAYTNHPEAVTHESITYVPRAVKRTDTSRRSLDPSENLVITLPADDAFALRYVATVPSSPDRLTIYRRHITDGDSETFSYWRGEVVGVAFQGEVARVECKPTASSLTQTIPKRTYRALCNHVLYDRGCKVNDSEFRFDVTVQGISNGGTSLVVFGEGISGQGAGFFDAGFLRQGEIDHRMVLASTDHEDGTLTLAILLPFEQIAIGDSLQLFAGCDHTLATCVAKFANQVNFGGFPYVPTKNPFTAGTGILDE